jgi:hypothetical protein
MKKTDDNEFRKYEKLLTMRVNEENLQEMLKNMFGDKYDQ